MEVLPIAELAPTERLSGALYDPVTGMRLLNEFDPLSHRGLRHLLDAKILEVALLAPGEPADELARRAEFSEVEISRLRTGQPVAHDLYSTDGSLLLSRGSVMTSGILQQLERRQFRKLFMRRAPDPDRAARVKRVRDLLLEERRATAAPFRFAPEDMLTHPRQLTERSVLDLTEELERTGRLAVPVNDSEALLRFVRLVDALHERARKTKEEYIALTRGLVAQTDRIFHNFRGRKPVNGELVMAMTEQVIRALVQDRELLLGTFSLPSGSEDYLPRHAVNVAILAVNIAAAAGFPPKAVAEAGVGALLADVGMLSVPDAIRLKASPLSSDEQLEVMRHTVYGIERLQCLSCLPRTSPLVAYQSHERCDGSGYPQGKRENTILDLAKIVALADVFHAQVEVRPHRPEGRLPYAAVEEILKMVGRGKLSRSFARAFLRAVSLFPVGSWVRLNTGETAQVLAPQGGEFTRPVVAVLYDAEGRPATVRRLSLVDERSLSIVAPARMDRAEPLAGF